MLLEKTIFQVDVLTLEVRFDPGTAGEFARHLPRAGKSREARDSLAAAAVAASRAEARLVFQRDVRLRRFLEGVDENMRKALEAGIVDSAGYRGVAEGLPVWFGHLAERGLKDGDRLLYRISGDTLRTVLLSVAGDTLLDQTDVGPERRRVLLGSWFAPGSEFRDKLVRSLVEAAARPAPAPGEEEGADGG